MASLELFGMSGGILWPEQVLPEQVMDSSLWRARRPVKCPLGYSWTSREKFKCSRRKYQAVQEPEILRKVFGWFLRTTTKKPITPWMPWDDSVEKSKTSKWTKPKWTTPSLPEGIEGKNLEVRQAQNYEVAELQPPEMPSGGEGVDEHPAMPGGGLEDLRKRDAPVKSGTGSRRLVKAPPLKESQPESDDESDEKSRGARPKRRQRGKKVG